ncbi:MAG: LPXTG cell wall anchor domain-containing protein [Firmicutes bacterium]|nr:LPXTG cell wall anchor domain-containing protein [Bacillota bacterium]
MLLLTAVTVPALAKTVQAAETAIPNIGDNTNLLPYIIIGAAALVLLVVLFFLRKKKDDGE